MGPLRWLTLLLLVGAPLPPPDSPSSPDLARHGTRRLEIPFEITTRGAAPVTRVRLWVTRDGGRSWQPAGESQAPRSPLSYDAPEDGRYGFRVVPEDAAGRSPEAPAPGAPPDVECIVDTALRAMLRIAPAADGARSDLQVEWSLTGEPPLKAHLEFSVDGGDRWLPLREVSPSGARLWRLPRLPEIEVRLRLVGENASGQVTAEKLVPHGD